MEALATIGRPLHVHNARTADDYLYAQAAFIAQQRRAHPHLPWRDPWNWTGRPPTAILTHGYWKIVPCLADECLNAPVVDPAWRLACCLECGAIYRGVILPAGWDAIEEELLKRPRMATRNWVPGETVSSLARERLRHVGQA